MSHLIVLVFCLLCGCASVVPASKIADAQARHGLAAQSPAAKAAGIPTGHPTRQWWKDLGDPILDELVDQTESQNHDLKAALAIVTSARALARGAQLEYLPQGGIDAKAVEQRLALIEVDPYRQGQPRPPVNRIGAITQSMAWEIDLFGRIGTAAAVADRQVDMASADVRAVRAVLHGEVVKHYVQLRHDQQDMVLLDQSIAVAEEHLRQMGVREVAGLVDRRMVLSASAEQAQRRSLRAQLAASERVHRVVLSVLLGQSPVLSEARLEELLAPRPMPFLPDDLQLAQPSDLLARRPDVVRADAQLRAQLGQVVLAERAHLPHLNLALVAGSIAPFGQLGQASALHYEAGPVLQWNWFDAGRYKAQEDATRAGADAAWHNFEQTVLVALGECESSIRQWSAARLSYAQAVQAQEMAQQAAAYARSRAEAGLEPPTTALEQTQAEIEARRARLSAQAFVLEAFSQVQLAMGEWVSDESR